MISNIVFFASVAASIAGQGLDVITTDAALAHNWKELNSIVSKIIAKVGFAPFALAKVGLFGIGFPVLFAALGHYNVASVVAAVIAAGGFWAGIRNYKLLKAANISVF